MSSLVQQLRDEALNSSTSASNLLQKALVVASSLNIQDFKRWIGLELKGYPDDLAEIPTYRRIQGRIQSSSSASRGRWVPVAFLDAEDAEIAQALSVHVLVHPIGEIESILRNEGAGQSLRFSLDVYAEQLLRTPTDNSVQFSRLVPKASISGVIDAIKTSILEWSLALEQEGILGDGLTFNPEEKESAQAITFHLNQVVQTRQSMTSKDYSINIQSGRDINNDGVLNLGTIIGGVTNEVQKVRDLGTPEAEAFADLLIQLEALIENDQSLLLEVKADALEQVRLLAAAGLQPRETKMQNIAKGALRMLRGIAAELPTATQLVTGLNTLLPAIKSLFGL